MLEIQICESLDGGIKQILLDGKPIQQHIRRVCLIFEKSCRPLLTLEPCADWDFTKAGLDIGTRYEAKLTLVPQAEGVLQEYGCLKARQ